jgi:hypothetical protein
MEILLNVLLVGLIVLVTHKLAASGKKQYYYWLGWGTVILSIAPILLYFYLGPPPHPGKYEVVDIEYTSCYIDGPDDGKSIILETGSSKYSIYYQLWPKDIGEGEIVNRLSLSSRAKVWLVSKDDTEIKGIDTLDFRIAPSKGYEWDRTNRKALLWLSAFFSFLGLLLILAVRFQHRSNG